MYTITSVNNSAKQTQKLILPNGKEADFYIEYKPMQLGWFLTFTYNESATESFTVSNIRIVTSPNMLHQFKNLIPFGLACVVAGNQEPLLKDDFSSGRAKLYILDDAEVQAFEDFLSGKVTA